MHYHMIARAQSQRLIARTPLARHYWDTSLAYWRARADGEPIEVAERIRAAAKTARHYLEWSRKA